MPEPKKFVRPPPLKDSSITDDDEDDEEHSIPNIYVANCGPAVGFSHAAIATVFGKFGEVVGVHAADESGARVIVCYSEGSSARAALEEWGGGISCSDLGGRRLHIRYSVLQLPRKINDTVPVSLEASELGIPGIYLLHDFISSREEQELLEAVDSLPWKNLANRRVQHYGYEFLYESRNVDSEQFLGDLPSFVSFIHERLPLFPNFEVSEKIVIDQLTVNEYPSGVGLAPHVDTHSAFEEPIFSLSLVSSCIMEFRRYPEDLGLPLAATVANLEGASHGRCLNFERRAIFLPPRSMLLMSREGRYAWHHYIPHHKVDTVRDQVIRRGTRRVSFTFRKVRRGSCCCEFPQFCDSQSKSSVSSG